MTTTQTIHEYLERMRHDAIKELQVFAAQLAREPGIMIDYGQDAIRAGGREAAALSMIRAIRNNYGSTAYRSKVMAYLYRSMANAFRTDNCAHIAMGRAYGEIIDFMAAHPDMDLA